MALDIVPMKPEELVCPYCGKTVLLQWQEAYYGGGEFSPQFIGLEKAVPTDAIQVETLPVNTERRKKRVSFLARQGDQPPKRVSFTISRDTKTVMDPKFHKNRVQAKNPKTERWVLIDTKWGRILGHKRDGLPYKNVMTVEELKRLCPKEDSTQ